MSHEGSALTLEEKKMVVHIKHFFDREKKNYLKNNVICVSNPAKRTALATNLSEVTVWTMSLR